MKWKEANILIKQLLIFDRWGELVFENTDFHPNDSHQGWDGFFRGKAMANGVYVYMAEIEFINGEIEVYSGDFVLLK